MVVSDLHLGAHSGVDLLRRAQVLELLLAQLAGFDRLVLLGDVLELRDGPAREVLSAAAPVLAELGEALGPGREVVIVPGNHDHQLLQGWLARRASDVPPPLGLEAVVDWRADEPLGAVAAALGPVEVRAAYPGVWLREDVYALHGHYGDRHTTVPMLERLGAGVMARVVVEAPGGPRRAEDYEATLAPLYAWLYAVAQARGRNTGRGSHGASARARGMLQGARAGGRGRRGAAARNLRHRGAVTRTLCHRGAAAAFPVLIAALNRAGLGPLRADLSGPELRHAALCATGEVLARLDVRAPHVIFGHTHRAGPLGADDPAEWLAPGGVQLLNPGSWVHEPAFLGERPHESPYRPGFCAVLHGERAPTLINVLDAVTGPAPA
ncbi:MAG: metallophosphoesterase [Solirubrobacteraceae bacterium]